MGKLRRSFFLAMLVVFSFKGFTQVYKSSIADFITMVEHPLAFLQKIENLGIKESGFTGLDSTHSWLKRIITAEGYKPVTQKFLNYKDTLRNIVFTKKGSIDSTIVICAHYDSWVGPGVNDNGTGNFALYQIAKLLKPLDSKYSITFIYFSGEEINFLGSKHYVRYLDKDSTKIKFVFNMDQLGGTVGEDNSGIKCERDEVSSHKAESNLIAQSLAKIYSLYTNLNPVITATYSSDYISFRDSGYVISGIYQYSSFPFYHSSSDLLKHIEFNSLISTVKGAVASIIYFSGAEIPVDNISKSPRSQNIDVYYTQRELIVNADQAVSVFIYDGLGKLVLDKRYSRNDKNISLKDLRPGIYFSYLQTENGFVNYKFLVEP